MEVVPALECYKTEVEKALREGHSVPAVEAELGENGKLLVFGMTPDGSVLTHVGVGQEDLLMQLVEYVFSQEAKQAEALHRLKEMPSASGLGRASLWQSQHESKLSPELLAEKQR